MGHYGRRKNECCEYGPRKSKENYLMTNQKNLPHYGPQTLKPLWSASGVNVETLFHSKIVCLSLDIYIDVCGLSLAKLNQLFEGETGRSTVLSLPSQ